MQQPRSYPAATPPSPSCRAARTDCAALGPAIPYRPSCSPSLARSLTDRPRLGGWQLPEELPRRLRGLERLMTCRGVGAAPVHLEGCCPVALTVGSATGQATVPTQGQDAYMVAYDGMVYRMVRPTAQALPRPPHTRTHTHLPLSDACISRRLAAGLGSVDAQVLGLAHHLLRSGHPLVELHAIRSPGGPDAADVPQIPSRAGLPGAVGRGRRRCVARQSRPALAGWLAVAGWLASSCAKCRLSGHRADGGVVCDRVRCAASALTKVGVAKPKYPLLDAARSGLLARALLPLAAARPSPCPGPTPD
jgi:hypothetical protein